MSGRSRGSRFTSPAGRAGETTRRRQRTRSANQRAAAALVRSANNTRRERSRTRQAPARTPTRASTSARRRRPAAARNDVTDVMAGQRPGDVIDLTDCGPGTSDTSIVDLTSPTPSQAGGVNDSAVIVIGTRERSRTREDLSTLVLSSDSDDSDDLPELDIPKQTVPTSPELLQLPQKPAGPTDSPQLMCPICMEDYKEIRQRGSRLASTTCGHIFCEVCIKSAVDTHKQCPLCRSKLRHKNYHTIHL